MNNPFLEELAEIKDESVRNFTEYVLDRRPAYFDSVPSSSTGKHHPAHENGHGGLVRHTKCVFYWTRAFAGVYNLAPIDIDVALSAALLHDIVKFGMGVKGMHTAKDHDDLGDKYIRILSKTAPTCKYVDEICKAVAAHMGRWKIKGTVIFPKDLNEIQQCVHLADVAASRKQEWLTKFEEMPLIG